LQQLLECGYASPASDFAAIRLFPGEQSGEGITALQNASAWPDLLPFGVPSSAQGYGGQAAFASSSIERWTLSVER
jgi:hypothetical protein